MNKSIFREKSLERIESPEQLNNYIKVANPGVWVILSAIIVLLAGMLAWGFWGDLSIYTPAFVTRNDGFVPSMKSDVIVLVHEEDAEPIGLGKNVEIDGKMYPISELDSTGECFVLFGGSEYEEDTKRAHYLGHDLGEGQSLWLVPFGVDYDGELQAPEEGYINSRVEISKRSPLSFLFD